MKKSIYYLLFATLGLFGGWLIFGGTEKTRKHAEEAQETIYTCSMHPQIRQPEFGRCPLCAMDLTPLSLDDGSAEDENSFTMSASAIALSNVEILEAKKSEPQKTLRLYGNIQANELKKHSQTAHIGGRIGNLFVNFEGERVRRGQTLASIYSPELLVAQREFLEILKRGQPDMAEAAKKRLQLLKIPESQISKLEETSEVTPYINIVADASGIVTAKRVERGEYVEAGAILFDIADLSSVWAVFDAYEADLPYLKTGDQISFTVNALPDVLFLGRVNFISPIVDAVSRTAKVRVETVNKDSRLKPGMLAGAVVQNARAGDEAIVLPRTAVLWTGERSVVYVAKKQENGALSLTLREVLLGASLGNNIKILSGISEGEFVVANGVFAVDASAQLLGKKSMMNLPQQGDGMNTATKLAAALAIVCTSALACEGHDGHNHAETSAKTASKQEAAIAKASLSVQGACGMCKTVIENAAKAVAGVQSASWDLQTKVLSLEFDSGKTSLNAVSKAIAATGYDTEKDRAPDAAYNALHGCCKYTRN
ncbi:MAG: efflux RND transporter periplasmic adaptor subunit [Fibromonadales bacterium]|nr:efflux RND transporter periplasmic adaptor subunit [Fibromonadales bacterium]